MQKIKFNYTKHFKNRAFERQVEYKSNNLEQEIRRYLKEIKNKNGTTHLFYSGNTYIIDVKYPRIDLITCYATEERFPHKAVSVEVFDVIKSMKIGEKISAYQFNMETLEYTKTNVKKISEDKFTFKDTQYSLYGVFPRFTFEPKKFITNKRKKYKEAIIAEKQKIKEVKKKIKKLKRFKLE